MLFKSKIKHIIEQQKNLYTIDLEEIEYRNKVQDILNIVPLFYPGVCKRVQFWVATVGGFLSPMRSLVHGLSAADGFCCSSIIIVSRSNLH